MTPTALQTRLVDPGAMLAATHELDDGSRVRLMLAATMPVDGSERIVGLADAAFLSTGLAEIGVVVDDESQGQGLGKRLSEAVASLAHQRGETHMTAEMLAG